MGWDVVALDLPRGFKDLGELPQDYSPKTLGKRSDLIRKIEEIVPDANFERPAYGEILRTDFVIEVCILQEENVESIGFGVHGDGEMAVEVIGDILDHLDLRAIDLSTGDYFSRESALESFKAWRDWKNKVLADENS